jgi:hypothetical protein
MLELSDYLAKLDKLNYVSAKGKTLQTEQGFEVSYELGLMSAVHGNYPIQFTFRVFKNGIYVSSWGCSDNDDNNIATKWFLTTKYKAEQLEYSIEDAEKDTYKKLFNNL